MRFSFLLLFLINTLIINAQTIDGLAAYFPFDTLSGGDFIDVSGRNSTAKINASTVFLECGVKGKAFRLDGSSQNAVFLGTINNYFSQRDFSVSVYLKPRPGVLGVRDIISKSDSCSVTTRGFFLKYNASSRQFIVQLAEVSNKNITIAGDIDPTQCWQHVVVTRAGNRTSLYINGRLAGDGYTNTRVNMANNAVLQLANGPCVAQKTEGRYAGLIDELRMYDRALKEDEIKALYFKPDQILTQDTIIFLGGSVPVRTTDHCDTSYLWTPSSGVSNVSIAEPLLSPTVSTTYKISFRGGQCIATDTIRVTVIDPASLDCTQLLIPNAFTPNGDGTNDLYGISNPYVINELKSFEIFDRWGGKLFFTTNPFEKWDGTAGGQALMPGMYVYKINYRCGSEEKSLTGSFALMR